MNNKTHGYTFGIIAAVTYGMNPLFALPLYADGMNPDSVLFFRYLIALPILAAMIRWRRRSFRLHRAEWMPVCILGWMMAASSLTLFLSYTYMAAGIASTILFIYPVLVAVLMAVGYRERISWLTWGCIALALAGIALLYHSDDGGHLSTWGVALVLASALSYALYMVGVNRPAVRSVPTVQLTFYVLLSGLMLFALRLLLGTSAACVEAGVGAPFTLPRSPWLWGNVVCLAALPTAVSLICTTRAIAAIGSTVTAILGALEPLTAIFFGVLVFDEPMTVRLAVGIALVIVAVTLIIAGGSIAHLLLRFRRLLFTVHSL